VPAFRTLKGLPIGGDNSCFHRLAVVAEPPLHLVNLYCQTKKGDTAPFFR
jgi:hypothetical protein